MVFESYLNDYNQAAEEEANKIFGVFLIASGIYPSYREKSTILLGFVLRFVHISLWVLVFVLLTSTMILIYPSSMSYSTLVLFLLTSIVMVAHPYYWLNREPITKILYILQKMDYYYAEEQMNSLEEKERSSLKKAVKVLERVIVGLLILGGVSIVGVTSFSKLFFPLSEEEVGLREKGVCVDLPAILFTPYDCTQTYWWIVSLLLGYLITSMGFVFLVAAISFHLTIMFHIYSHLRIIKLGLDTLTERAVEYFISTYNKEEIESEEDLFEQVEFRDCYLFCFKESFLHYIKVRTLFRSLAAFLRFPLFLVFFLASLMMASSGVAVASNDVSVSSSISMGLTFIVHSMMVWIFCYSGEYASSLHQDVQLSLYSIQWYNLSVKIRQDLLVAMRVTLTDLKLETSWGIQCNMNTFGTILNTAYSYINLLLTFKLNSNK